MNRNFLSKELFISLVLIVLLLLFLDPFDFLMPPSFVMMAVIFVIVVFSIFSAVVWRENPKDERESFLGMFAGRVAYLSGTTILLLGIVFQEIKHRLDPWLVYALMGMIIAKTMGLLYGQKKH